MFEIERVNCITANMSVHIAYFAVAMVHLLGLLLLTNFQKLLTINLVVVGMLTGLSMAIFQIIVIDADMEYKRVYSDSIISE